ncbi:MAG: MBL fold metallo-hydrolase [Roseitalea porphyridii]|jgi:ribonuclease BN (tRNA processing enzyme)|uniref:MBL fold metallo-hydrolase n=1 Tax=Alphaproteobacteria TaxID=28211 RepID=UPI0032EBD8AF
MKLTFVGSGDAFGSGGRFQTCFHVEAAAGSFLIDCGASSMIALKRAGIDRNAIGMIFITHFHGDHFGGIPYFILDAQFFSKRREPLTIVGPPGLKAWLERVTETTFPGSFGARRAFGIELVEIAPGQETAVGGIVARAELVRHGRPEGPFLAYRFAVGDRVLAYTGDTEWTETLIEIGREADLLIAEAYTFDKKVPLHLDLQTLEANLPRIAPKRLILTHMSEDMLSRLPNLPYETAEDGKTVVL